MSKHSAPAKAFHERLVPGPGLFLACAMLIPAVALVTLPLNARLSIPAGLTVYALVVLALIGLSPVLEVDGDTLRAGNGQIPVRFLGSTEALDREGLKAALGPGSDARAYRVVRGWIHSGITVEINDPVDPAPFWIITTRKPEALRKAIAAAQGSEQQKQRA